MNKTVKKNLLLTAAIILLPPAGWLLRAFTAEPDAICFFAPYSLMFIIPGVLLGMGTILLFAPAYPQKTTLHPLSLFAIINTLALWLAPAVQFEGLIAGEFSISAAILTLIILWLNCLFLKNRPHP